MKIYQNIRELQHDAHQPNFFQGRIMKKYNVCGVNPNDTNLEKSSSFAI